jgi:FkbM family methyltransferase
MVHPVFPIAEYHLFEPLAETISAYQDPLAALAGDPKIRSSIHAVAVDDISGRASLGMAESPFGSSLLVDEVSEWFPRAVDVPTVTLDEYVCERGLEPAELMKIDTQGSELRILRGAERSLRRAEVLVLETWLVRGYGAQTPLLREVVDWLDPRGFETIDFGGEFRDDDGRLVAVDVVFGRRSVIS